MSPYTYYPRTFIKNVRPPKKSINYFVRYCFKRMFSIVFLLVKRSEEKGRGVKSSEVKGSKEKKSEVKRSEVKKREVKKRIVKKILL